MCVPFQDSWSLNVLKHNFDSLLGQGAWDAAAVEVFHSHTITTTHAMASVLLPAIVLPLAANF